jgi:tetratricopeptide (TPR) repeat protein
MNTWAVVALGLVSMLVFSGNANADQTDPRLQALFTQLRVATSSDGAAGTERAIWDIWTTASDEHAQQLLDRGMQRLAAQQFNEAIALFTEVIRVAPAFAEAWNKRATAHFLRREFAQSVKDIRQTLALEPRHFGAISGLGLIFMHQRDADAALNAFHQVIEIHPNASGARARIEMLQRFLRRQAV